MKMKSLDSSLSNTLETAGGKPNYSSTTTENDPSVGGACDSAVYAAHTDSRLLCVFCRFA